MPWLSLAGLLALQSGCRPQTNPAQSSTVDQTNKNITLTIFAAASLTEAFNEIGERFEAENPGVRLSFNYAGSQQLAQQLAQGAVADVFASADLEHLQDLEPLGIVPGGSEQALAQNRLVVIYNTDSPVKVITLQDLAIPGLHLVLAAETVPAGKYSLRFLDNASRQADFGAGYRDDVLRNVMSYEENVKAVYSKVLLGEADAGIVYTSDLATERSTKIEAIDIPEMLNPTARYYIAPLKDGSNPDLAMAFIDFALSPAGQEILKNFGFIPVD